MFLFNTCCLIYSNNQWKIQKVIGVNTALAVNTELHTNLVYDTNYNYILPNYMRFLLNTEFFVFANSAFQRKCSCSHSIFSFVHLTTPYVSSNSIGCNSNLEKPHWPN